MRATIECNCGNDARYVDETGDLVCGLCPVKLGRDAIKISSIPSLLEWCREVLAGGTMGGSSFEELRSIIGRKPPQVPLMVTVEQLVNDKTYETCVPTSQDGHIIGEQLAERLVRHEFGCSCQACEWYRAEHGS